jgi:chemotaxis family two-component system response regulator Rcp1
MSTKQTGKPLEILLVEDNPADVRLTQEAIRRTKAHVNLSVANNGDEALAILRKEGKYAESVRPNLVLLDVNMPRKDGWAVLREMKHDRSLDCIPVIVLTSSAAEDDICKAYKYQASSYISKPPDLAGLNEVIESIQGFWIKVASLPKHC